MRFELQLTQINNFKTKANLQNNIYLQLENAYFLCRPPERTALKSKKKLTDLENFIRYLFFEKMDEEKVLIENILRLPVKKCEDYLIKIFMKVATRGRYGQMNKICAILRYIGQFYPQLQVRITDQVIEHIISGLETNYSGDRQKRITMIKFFAELFNYQVIEKGAFFPFVADINLPFRFGLQNAVFHHGFWLRQPEPKNSRYPRPERRHIQNHADLHVARRN